MAEYEDYSTVVSILPVPIREIKYGLIPADYAIPAVKDPTIEFNLLHIARARFAVYIDENRPALVVPEPSDRVAAAICRDYKVSVPHVEFGVSEPGLFWVKDKKVESDFKESNLKAILTQARTMQMEWFKRQVAEADDHWSRYRMRKMISDMQRKASKL